MELLPFFSIPLVKWLSLLSMTLVIVGPLALLDGRFQSTATKSGMGMGTGEVGWRRRVSSKCNSSGLLRSAVRCTTPRPRPLLLQESLRGWWSAVVLPRPPPGAAQLAAALMLHEARSSDNADADGAPLRNQSFGSLTSLVGRMTPQRKRRKMTLVLDLDETLIHGAGRGGGLLGRRGSGGGDITHPHSTSRLGPLRPCSYSRRHALRA